LVNNNAAAAEEAKTTPCSPFCSLTASLEFHLPRFEIIKIHKSSQYRVFMPPSNDPWATLFIVFKFKLTSDKGGQQ
jgi:hypothetical protein